MKVIDKTLINTVKEMAKKEKIVKAIRGRTRIRGIIVAKSETKNGNIKLRIKGEESTATIIIIKTHKERYILAYNLFLGTELYAEGIRRFRIIICTKLIIPKGKQRKKKERILNFN